MLTADGPVLLECNARFGDPETQVLLPRLAAPPRAAPLLAAARGRLKAAIKALGIDSHRIPTLPARPWGWCLAASGYPEEPRPGDAIEGLHAARATGRAGLPRRDGPGRRRRLPHRRRPRADDRRAWPDLAAARDQAEGAAQVISFDGLQRRHDIGLRALLETGALVLGGAR
jgi:phosphoribosylamine--glycine ligase